MSFPYIATQCRRWTKGVLRTHGHRGGESMNDVCFSVIICAYTEERWDDLMTAVGSVRAQRLLPHEIIVVVDHNPALLARVERDLPSVHAVPNHEPRGLGGARNSGITAATGDIVAFLDDDAVAIPEWLEQFASAYDTDVVGVGGAIEPQWQSGRPRWFPEEFDWVVGCTYRGIASTTQPVRNLIGCNMSYRRWVFDAVGAFRLGYGCDETEFCIRLGRQWPNKRLLYNPSAKVRHRVPASRARWRYFRSRCYFEGRSKAVVAWISGREDGLASERAHTLRTLPKGIVRGVADAVLRRDPAGFARAGAIVAGLAVTTAGYVSGMRATDAAARERGWTGDSQDARTGLDGG